MEPSLASSSPRSRCSDVMAEASRRTTDGPVHKTRRHTNCPYEYKNKLTVSLADPSRFPAAAIGWGVLRVGLPAGEFRGWKVLPRRG